ncbi:MAG: ArsR/SmtB family transcription factor [Acidimicrobiales bacterium]
MTGTVVYPEVDRAGMRATARYFRALGDPTRLSILDALTAGPCSASELARRVSAPQSRVSNHLACLRWCGFVVAQPSGRKVLYRLADTGVSELVEAARCLAAGRAEHLETCDRIGPDWV